jgi:hypothetical protein
MAVMLQPRPEELARCRRLGFGEVLQAEQTGYANAHKRRNKRNRSLWLEKMKG